MSRHERDRLVGRGGPAEELDIEPALAGVHVTELVAAPLRRGELHERLETRFRGMMEAGFLEEVRRLRGRPDLTAEHPSMRAVGYRQLWRHVAGSCSLEEASQSAVIATRQLAKRQLTWLRRRARADWFDAMRIRIVP